MVDPKAVPYWSSLPHRPGTSVYCARTSHHLLMIFRVFKEQVSQRVMLANEKDLGFKFEPSCLLSALGCCVSPGKLGDLVDGLLLQPGDLSIVPITLSLVWAFQLYFPSARFGKTFLNSSFFSFKLQLLLGDSQRIPKHLLWWETSTWGLQSFIKSINQVQVVQG